MRAFTIGLCSVIWGLTASLQAEDPTAFQKKVYEEVNGSLTSFKEVEKEIALEGAEEPSIVTAWIDDGQIRKMEVGDPGDHGTCTREYYFDEEGNLVFVYQAITTEEMQTGKIVAKVHDRFYFKNDKLFHWIDTDKKPVAKSDPRFAEYEEELIKCSEGYAPKILKAAGSSKTKEKSGGKQVTEGTFQGIDQGDYFHLQIKDSKGEDVSYFLLQQDKTFDPFMKNPDRFIGKKVRVTWVSKKEDIPEAGGKIQVESALSIELVK